MASPEGSAPNPMSKQPSETTIEMNKRASLLLGDKFDFSALEPAREGDELQEEEMAKYKSDQVQGSIATSAYKFRYGAHAIRGRRQSMEDAYFICDDLKRTYPTLQHSEHLSYFSVFDGHGGRRAADFAVEKLLDKIVKHADFLEDPHKAMQAGYLETDAEFLSMARPGSWTDGSTAVTVFLFGNRIITGNLGDSRAIMSRGGRAIPLSMDHKPSRLSERLRVENAGGRISRAQLNGMLVGPFRVYPGGLAVSRAFGDMVMKGHASYPNVLTADPEILEETLGAEDDFIVIATDGLWDVFSNQQVVDFIRKYPDPRRAAELICLEAERKGSTDNVTTVVIRLARCDSVKQLDA